MLVEAKSYFDYSPIAPELLVDKANVSYWKGAMPYAKDETVTGRVTSVQVDTKANSASVRLEDGRVIKCQRVIVACGSKYADPVIKASHDSQAKSITEREQQFISYAEKIAQAKDIVVIGGGQTGVETAGAILDKYVKDIKDAKKKLTLVAGPAGLLPAMDPKVRHTHNLAHPYSTIVLITFTFPPQHTHVT